MLFKVLISLKFPEFKLITKILKPAFSSFFEELQTLENLKANQNVVVLKADTINATVILGVRPHDSCMSNFYCLSKIRKDDIFQRPTVLFILGLYVGMFWYDYRATSFNRS